MKRTEWREETKQMRFEDAYAGWSEPFGNGHQTHSRHAGLDPASRRKTTGLIRHAGLRSGIQKKGKRKTPGSPITNVGDDDWCCARE